MIRAFSFILIVVAGTALSRILAVYAPDWAIVLLGLLFLIIWAYTVDKGLKDNG